MPVPKACSSKNFVGMKSLSDNGQAQDDGSISSSEGSNDPADELFQRQHQRSQFLREMAQTDAEARSQGMADAESMLSTTNMTKRTSNGRSVLLYNQFLKEQRFYDDLKHVDYHYIYFDTTSVEGGVLVEQDKSLGKGGLCWDAAYILSDYLAAFVIAGQTSPNTEHSSAIELGCGTGVCGLLLAAAMLNEEHKFKSSLQTIHLTDLPSLQPLFQRNVQRLQRGDWTEDGIEETDSSLIPSIAVPSNRLDLRGFVLDWENHDLHWPSSTTGDRDRTYDIVFGADVVATLYDPSALVRTIHRLCHASSVVYISFKERLSTIHRQFEGEMRQCFASIEILQRQDANDEGLDRTRGVGVPSQQTWSKNRNPDVHILVARQKIFEKIAP